MQHNAESSISGLNMLILMFALDAKLLKKQTNK